jgi:hypothetical protein
VPPLRRYKRRSSSCPDRGFAVHTDITSTCTTRACTTTAAATCELRGRCEQRLRREQGLWRLEQMKAATITRNKEKQKIQSVKIRTESAEGGQAYRWRKKNKGFVGHGGRRAQSHASTYRLLWYVDCVCEFYISPI